LPEPEVRELRTCRGTRRSARHRQRVARAPAAFAPHPRAAWRAALPPRADRRSDLEGSHSSHVHTLRSAEHAEIFERVAVDEDEIGPAARADTTGFLQAHDLRRAACRGDER